jgi:hypothetical protein
LYSIIEKSGLKNQVLQIGTMKFFERGTTPAAQKISYLDSATPKNHCFLGTYRKKEVAIFELSRPLNSKIGCLNKCRFLDLEIHI